MMDHPSYYAGLRPALSIFVCFLLAALLAGCGNSMSPEEAAAISKYQNLGGKIVFDHGGYRLQLGGRRVTDEDLKDLAKIKNLKRVDLQRTGVTDKGLVHLEPLQSVLYIDLTGTSVTPEGIERLEKALPNTEVLR